MIGLRRPWRRIPALLLCLLLAGCAGRGAALRPADLPGGREDLSWADAPLSIASKEPVSFQYEFSCAFLERSGRQLDCAHCSLRLLRQEDGALCSIQGERLGQDGFALAFTAPLSSLDALQAVIDKHGIAKVNGIYRHTNGLPEHQGASIRAEYASGERFSAQDNAFPVLGEAATLALIDLFGELAREAGHECLASGEADPPEG